VCRINEEKTRQLGGIAEPKKKKHDMAASGRYVPVVLEEIQVNKEAAGGFGLRTAVMEHRINTSNYEARFIAVKQKLPARRCEERLAPNPSPQSPVASRSFNE
jgi:hypothetical protein